ncbi:hypothetical protein FOZ60_013732, partial [Perkinsus olseni]
MIFIREPQPPALSFIKTSAGFFAQIDGGSQYSLLARRAVERQSSDYPLLTLPHPLIFEAVNGTTFTSDTAVVLSVLGVPVRFIIVDRLPQGIEALVGVDLVNVLVIDYVHKTAQHLGTGQKLPLYRPHDSHDCGLSSAHLVGTRTAQPDSYSHDYISPDDSYDSLPEYILQQAPTTSPDLPWSHEYNMRIIKDYGWLKIGLLPTPADTRPSSSAQHVFCAEISQQVLDDAYKQKQVDVKVHKQYLLADKAVQTEFDALTSSAATAPSTSHILPADPIDLLNGYNTNFSGARTTYISSYMDDITLYLGKDLEGHEQ